MPFYDFVNEPHASLPSLTEVTDPLDGRFGYIERRTGQVARCWKSL